MIVTDLAVIEYLLQAPVAPPATGSRRREPLVS